MKQPGRIFLLILGSILLFGCAPKESWELVWSDEFETDGIPAGEHWGYETGYIRNQELQHYTSEAKNVRVENGFCIITALLEEGEDSITSASINTLGKQDFLYGRIEVRAQIPSALGTWPAIWMLGTNRSEIEWPACGEIDIMEHVGYDPDWIHANIHTEAYNHVAGTNKGNRIEVEEPWAGFHLYALEWFEDRMDFFMDDSLYFSFENDGEGNNDTWPFDKPHYLLINLAYGGSWGGNEGVDVNRLPVEYKIDYVRYYTRPSGR
jgi:beta-glucanase (GH16 family)